MVAISVELEKEIQSLDRWLVGVGMCSLSDSYFETRVKDVVQVCPR